MPQTAVNIWREYERELWAPKTELTVSQWSEQVRVLSSTSEERGPFRLRRVPYMQPVMDAFDDPEVEIIVMCKPAQIAYTTVLENIIGKSSTEETNSVLLV